MSTYEYLHCPDCKASSDDLNRGGPQLIEAWKHRRELQALLDGGFWDVGTLESHDGLRRGVALFVIEHTDCPVEGRDEYGRTFELPCSKCEEAQAAGDRHEWVDCPIHDKADDS